MYPSRFSDPDTKIYGNKSSPCEQADASVFESGFTEEVHWCKAGETEWVEYNISYATASSGEHLHFGMLVYKCNYKRKQCTSAMKMRRDDDNRDECN